MSDVETAKRALRVELLTARTELSAEDARRGTHELTQRALRLPEVADARTVALYVSIGREPGTRELLEELHRRGVRVLLPVLLPDNDLDWAVYRGAEHLTPAGRLGRSGGLLEPAGPRLGPDAVTTAETILLPGLAVDRRGARLGRGGGSYDRVLARLAAAGVEPALLVLLYDAEVLDEVPAADHDRPVRAAVTPSGVRRFAAPPAEAF